MRLRSFLCVILFALIALLPAFAKDQPGQILTWPDSGTPVLRFTFGKFKEIGGVGTQNAYVTDTIAENLWSKSIPDATFSLYLFDKNKTRVGEGYITLSNVGPGQTVRFQTTIQSSGSPVSLSLAARSVPGSLDLPRLRVECQSRSTQSHKVRL